MIRIHAKGLLALAAFFLLVALGVDVRLGLAALAAGAALEALSLILPFVPRARGDRLK